MQKLRSLNPQVTFYIRTAKKTGFIEKSKKSVFSLKELKEVVLKKTKIPAQNQILYYNGSEVKQNKTIKIVEKSIVHVIDSRNVGQPRMRLSVKRLQQTSQSDEFQVDSNTSIDQFIKRELQPFYEQPAEKLFFVYSGRQLRRQKSFSEEHVESESEIVCVHAEKDRKGKKKTQSKGSWGGSLQSKDTIQTKTELTPKKQALSEALNHSSNRQISAQNVSEVTKVRYNSVTSLDAISSEQLPQRLTEQSQKRNEYLQQTQKNQKLASKAQRKVIKSIEQIKCEQLESDQDSDKEGITEQTSIFPKKLPEQYLMQQTRQRSNTKSDNQNNSGSSSISQPNFKKKKKAGQVDSAKESQQKRLEQTSPKSLSLKKSPSDNPPSSRQRASSEQKAQNQKEQVEGTQMAIENHNHFRTRQQIFENSNNVYSSVIDQPEESLKPINLLSGNSNLMNQRDDIFSSYINRQENQVYDSQMNYSQGQNTKIEVKGFMNFSNTSFLEPSQVQIPQNPSNEHQEISFRQTSNGEIKNSEYEAQQSNCIRAPEFLSNENQENFHRQQNRQIGGDSLSFSQEQSEARLKQESEDNLFVQYRRGPSPTEKNSDIMIREDEESQSNLLSQTYNNPNGTQIMNSITFNLEPNPDDLITHSRQSAVNIISEDDAQEPHQIQYEKRDSQVETNIRDSANPSQIYSNSSSRIRPKQSEQYLTLEQMSLIDGLASTINYQINVNSIESQDSANQSDHKPLKNYVDPQSDIQYDPANEHTIQTVGNQDVSQYDPSKLYSEDNSEVFVQFQAYTANFQSSLNQSKQGSENMPKYRQTNLLEENSFGIDNQISFQSNFLKSNSAHNGLLNTQLRQAQQNDVIKIIEEESVSEQNQLIQDEGSKRVQFQQNTPSIQEMEQSAAFHQITQSMNCQKVEQQQNLLSNNDNQQAYNMTFQKDQGHEQNHEQENEQKSKMEEPQGSRLLHELSLQAMYEPQQPQLLPGDYIYSTDRIQSPQQALDSILQKFAHCF